MPKIDLSSNEPKCCLWDTKFKVAEVQNASNILTKLILCDEPAAQYFELMQSSEKDPGNETLRILDLVTKLIEKEQRRSKAVKKHSFFICDGFLDVV